MKTTIVYAHPWDKSFNNSIIKTIINSVSNYTLIDLYADNFNPVMSQADLACYNKGESNDALVNKYLDIIEDTDQIVFVFPIWWYDAPAILRGFLDKVLLKNRTYIDGKFKLEPVLNIEKTYVITTSGVPTDTLINDFGNTISNTFINGTLESVGMKNAQWHNCGSVHDICDDEREQFLCSIKLLFI